ncbi:hypothetical protein ACF09H_29795 [Streptomyces sp. NPDC014983]|uniref:hypothetical protein n=1 Tax=Streptomyces sp. NPDC014983 TaxID=3364933 RepID=UPI0036F77412
MPNRRAVILALTQDVLGAQRWNGLTRECVTMPTADYEAVEDGMAAVLERTASVVDWDQLLREAADRHHQLHPDQEQDGGEWSPAKGVCGECLEEAFLTETRAPRSADPTMASVQAAMGSLLERMARAISWPRLLREAASRHIHLHIEEEPEGTTATGVCGPCLEEALLAEDMGAPDWERHPVSPREHQDTDWPSLVAKHFHHRAAAHWHPFKEPLPDGHRP